MQRRELLLLMAAAAGAACGYKVGGTSDLLPAQMKTIYIPAFGNNTTRYRLTQRLPGAISREFITRTRYRVVGRMEDADAVLEGTVNNYMAFPTIFDSATGRASGMQVSIYMNLKLTERATGKIIFQRPSMEVRGRAEVSTDQREYFDETEAALDRLSKELARGVVSAILEAF